MADRVLKSKAFTASFQYLDASEAATDPGTVTVAVDREDGTSLVPAGTATSGMGTSPRTFNLTTTHTAQLDVLKLTWTSATLGVRTSYVEVVGGFLASVAEIRAESPLSNTTTYPTTSIIAARTIAEQALEDACDVAFVPRYAREVRNGNGSTDILPFRPLPRSVISAVVDGTTVTDVVIDQERGTFYRAAGWGSTRQGVTLKYEAGYAYPPANCAQVVAKLVKFLLVDSPANDRATSIASDEGTQFLVTAGVRGAIFNIPIANAFVESYGMGVNVG